jgi:hypothetical protein
VDQEHDLLHHHRKKWTTTTSLGSFPQKLHRLV